MESEDPRTMSRADLVEEVARLRAATVDGGDGRYRALVEGSSELADLSDALGGTV